MNEYAVAQSQQLGDMLVFAKVVEMGSFTAAAQALGLGKSAVSKQVQRLEASHAVKFLHRTTRKLSLTEAGQVLFEHAEQIARLSGAAHDALAQLRTRPAGLLRITASVTYGKHVLGPLLVEFHRRYADVRVALTLVDRVVDLAEEGFDLAIRLTDRPPEGLAGRPLHHSPLLLCAKPSLLRGNAIRHPKDLRAQPCLGFFSGAAGRGMNWHFEREGEAPVEVHVSGPVAVNSSDVMRELVLGGMGFGLLPRFTVERDLAEKRLKVVLPQWHPRGGVGSTAWALWQADRHMPPKLRVMIDFLLEKLHPPLLQATLV